jgi:cadmium resistance protein CadD (predicted permease)
VNSLIAIIPVAAGAYIATNLDNLVLLVLLLTRYRNHTPNVIAGYFVCMLILGFTGFWIGKAANIAPVEYLGLLGLVPISIGVIGIVRLYRGKAEAPAANEKSTDGVQTAFMATLISQLGNGADTIVTFGALFADSMPSADILIMLTLAAMAVIFVLVAIYAIRHPKLNESIRRYGHRVTPFILIIVGAYILANTATDLLPD